MKEIKECKVLMVGAGGIGCELLKNLVMSGYDNITIVDLDTIDLSNLNRQFLFQSKHIKQSKAMVAKESVLRFNPNVNITAHFANIFDDDFSVEWFESFDIILNALDNLKARQRVNMMAQAADVPIVESGTAGYLGQVSVHLKGKTRCFDCDPHPTPKTFPVCTIRSTPSTPIHCIVWAKSYLLPQLFGKEEEEADMSNADADQDELQELQKEAAELKQLKALAGNPEFAEKLFNKAFKTDIERLLEMEDLWKTRDKPTPLEYSLSDSASALSDMDREQRVWDLPYTISVFTSSLLALQSAYSTLAKDDPEAVISFDKDDKDCLDFVTACANLRSRIYGIEQQSQFKVKEMAGNIIPAIATTNAIIAGLIVIQATKLLRDEKTRNVYLGIATRGARQLLTHEKLQPPNTDCGVCSVTYLKSRLNVTKAALGDVIVKVLNHLGTDESRDEVSVHEGDRFLYDVDFDDNKSKTLGELGIGQKGKSLLFTMEDQDENQFSAVVFIQDAINDEIVVEGKVNGIQRRSVKRKAPEEEEEEVQEFNEGPSKKIKLSGNNGTEAGAMHLVLEEEDDVIVL